MSEAKRSVYHHEVPTTTIDVYRVLLAFEVSDPCVQHAVKKLLCLGRRIGGKSEEQDVREAIWTLSRWLEMRAEEQQPAGSEATEEQKNPQPVTSAERNHGRGR